MLYDLRLWKEASLERHWPEQPAVEKRSIRGGEKRELVSGKRGLVSQNERDRQFSGVGEEGGEERWGREWNKGDLKGELVRWRQRRGRVVVVGGAGKKV